MKKTAIVYISAILICSILAGAMVLIIYNKNFGPDYRGRARIHYNWNYYFTTCPQKEHKYDGKYFSFAYPGFEEKSPIKEVPEKGGGAVFAYLLDVRWQEETDNNVKTELASYLAYPAGTISSSPSSSFMHWLTGFKKHASTYMEKLSLTGGGEALLLSGHGKDRRYFPGLDTNPYHKYVYVTGFTADGLLFKAYILSPLNIPETLYSERVFGPVVTGDVFPSAERDAMSACVLNEFLRTFKIKKPEKTK